MTPPNTTNGAAFEAYFTQTLLPAVQSLHDERQRVRNRRRWIALLIIGLAIGWGFWLLPYGTMYLLFPGAFCCLTLPITFRAPSSIDDKYKALLNPLLLRYFFEELRHYQPESVGIAAPLFKIKFWPTKIIYIFERDYFQARSGRIWCEGFHLRLDKWSRSTNKSSEPFFEGFILKLAWSRKFTGNLVICRNTVRKAAAEGCSPLANTGTGEGSNLLFFSDQYGASHPLLSSSGVRAMIVQLFDLDSDIYRVFFVDGFMYVAVECHRNVLEYSFNTDYSKPLPFQKMLPYLQVFPQICRVYERYLNPDTDRSV